jgi:phosphoribosyl-ATP pyrophosphohydrolase/phosphoribosyl-AMP cyclohydrolase
MQPDFNKNADGLLPAVIQDAFTGKVLMLGYMNQQAYEITLNSKKITFYSRSKQRIWTKGETSGNFLYWENIQLDCDNDALLIKAKPQGPVCHTGNDTCWNEKNDLHDDFIKHLENIIDKRKSTGGSESYTKSLFEMGINKIAQKVGEEAVELIIEAKDTNDELFLNEAADLFFHYLILLKAKNFSLNDVIKILKDRHFK